MVICWLMSLFSVILGYTMGKFKGEERRTIIFGTVKFLQ